MQYINSMHKLILKVASHIKENLRGNFNNLYNIDQLS